MVVCDHSGRQSVRQLEAHELNHGMRAEVVTPHTVLLAIR